MSGARVALLVLVTAGALGLAAPAVEAGIPDWAKPIAESAPPVPEGSPEWPSRTLFTERRVVVDPQGATWRIVERRAEQILSNRVDDLNFGVFMFNDDTKVKRSNGWHLAPGERATRNFGGSVDITITDAFLTDAKARAVALEGVKKGSLVFYEFVAERKPWTLTESFYFGSASVPVDLERVIVEAPDGWTLRHAWLRTPGTEPIRDATRWTFESKDWVPPKREPMGPDPGDRAPILVIALEPPPGAPSPVAALPDWNAFGHWFQGIAAGRDAVDPSVERTAKDVLAAAGPAPLDRIRAVALFVRDRVRYLSRSVGIGGYTPHAAKATLAELYGDCKDKGTLFRSVLAASGFVSYPILINATRPDTVAVDVPDPGAFDHFIVGVQWPKDTPAPEGVGSSMIDLPGFGKILVVDTTDEFAWPGTLPATLARRRGALVAGDNAVLVTMPPGDPATHRIERVTATTLSPAGGTAIKLDVKYFGWPAESARAAYAASALERRKDVEGEVRRAWPGADIKEYRATAQTDQGAYAESFVVDLPAGSAALQDGLLAVFAGATYDVARVPLTKRTGSVVFEGPILMSYSAEIVGLPEGGSLPVPHDASGDGWSVRSSVQRDGTAVRGTWTYERTRTRFEPDAFPEAKQMWSALSKATSGAVSIK